MTGRISRRLAMFGFAAAAILAALGQLVIAGADDEPIETGPDIVILRELESQYEPVPFDHLTHAKMAQMWDGCVTCHHRPPKRAKHAGDSTTATLVVERPKQEDSSEIPACKSCHPVTSDEADIHMPNLKGAYHRQCLNCHKEWMHENACVICHAPKEGVAVVHSAPMPDDIVGRMHPPIPEPDDVYYNTRFTPVAGGNVLFRHREHTVTFGIRCVDCHHRGNCADCHDPEGRTYAEKPLRPGMTWEESHGPCMGCHDEARCRHCHYRDDEVPPEAFTHTSTGQLLDDDHVTLACAQCHTSLQFESLPTCGDAACHKDQPINYPDQLPGPVATPLPDVVEGDRETSGLAKRPAGNGHL